MRINQNIMALNAYRNLDNTQNMLAKSLEKLSSGYRINRAADDASGLVISQGLRAQVSGLRQATRNAQDGVSVVQTAEGSLTEVHAMLNRVRDLIIQSANTASSDTAARQAAQNEITQLRSEIDRIAGTTAFGTQKLLNGSFGAQAARATNVTTGIAAGTGATVSSVGMSFTLVLDSGATTSVSLQIVLTTGTYVTAASFEAQLQTQISGAISAAVATGFTGGVTANVRDLGSGAWSVELVRNNTSVANSKITTTAIGTGLGQLAAVSGTLSNTGGGIFQVGANVTATDQIAVSIDDIRITGGTNAAFTSLAGIDVTNTATFGSAQSLIDDAVSSVSDTRGKLGAAQNRFESTISNLQVTSENLAASESRIRDTDMALEMVSFTRHQILLQAGTAMLAQANAAPQSMLRLLQ